MGVKIENISRLRTVGGSEGDVAVRLAGAHGESAVSYLEGLVAAIVRGMYLAGIPGASVRLG